MVTVIQPYMDVESSRSSVDKLFSSDQQKCLEAVMQLKNSIIGSNKQKGYVIQMGILPRLVQFLSSDNTSQELLLETVVTIGSLAKGTDLHIEALIDAGIVPLLLRGLCHSNSRYVDGCLRCLRTIFQCPLAPVGVLYSDQTIIPHLLQMALQPVASTQECVTTILTYACQNPENQNFLCQHGAIQALAALICSQFTKVQIPSLRCLAQLCYENENVCTMVATTSYDGKCVLDVLTSMMSRDKPNEMQLAAAKCMTYLYRAGPISSDDKRIVFKTIPTLVRLCKKDQTVQIRVEAADTMAYLIELDMDLQLVASITDHLIPTIAELLKYQAEQDAKVSQDVRQAAFKVFAAVAANDEDIRKKVSETENLMEQLIQGITDPSEAVRVAAIKCLHSLSRSVQQLRTAFQDHAVWRPLLRLLQNASAEVITLVSATLCNLLLEFSPNKERTPGANIRPNPILEYGGVVDLLCELTKREEMNIRLNGVWALMNMAFQADQKLKTQIIDTLGTDQIFRLLSDSNVNVVMKTLGLLRNLLSVKAHIDYLVGVYGKHMIQAVILILEGDHPAEVKEQALCILANIADGDSARDFIMTNDDVLKQLTSYLLHTNIQVKLAAIYCVTNLAWNEEGALERQLKLQELGIQSALESLMSTDNTVLFSRAKTAYELFPKPTESSDKWPGTQ